MAGTAGAGLGDPGLEALAEALRALAPGREPAGGGPGASGVAEAEARLAAVEAEVKDAEDLAARKRDEVAEAKRQLDLLRKKQDPAWRDWGDAFGEGLPDEVLAKVAGMLVTQNEAEWAAQRKEWGWDEEHIQQKMEKRNLDGNCLFVFAMVSKEWRKAQLKVGGPLCTRVGSDVTAPGSVALVKWALAECPSEQWPSTIAEAAARYGHLELVQWLHGEGGFTIDETPRNVPNVRAVPCRIDERMRFVIAEAARSGNLELVRWLRGKGCKWDDKACALAAERGHIEVLQWLRANDCPWDWSTCNAAAGHGQLDTLCWARVNGCDWNAGTCGCAARRGHLEVLQWLRTNGCPWDKWTCHNAVAYGHVEVLRWARENGCPWDTWVRDDAAAELGYTDDLGNLE